MRKRITAPLLGIVILSFWVSVSEAQEDATSREAVFQPGYCDCLGGVDQYGDYWNLLDYYGNPLQDSDWVCVVYAGSDGEISPPDTSGYPAGDDELILVSDGQIVSGMFFITVSVWHMGDLDSLGNQRHPVPGDLIYCRIFDGPEGSIRQLNFYGDADLHEISSITGDVFYCQFPGDPGYGYTDTPISWPATLCTCYGGKDSSGHSWSLLDASGISLEDGDYVYAAWVGPDGQIDPPAVSKGIGFVSGDDVFLSEGQIEDGLFELVLPTWDSGIGHPQLGDGIYCRIFDEPEGSIGLDDHYGNSQVHACQHIEGEQFYCLFPDDPDSGYTDTILYDQPTSCICYGGRDALGNSWDLSDYFGDTLEDGDHVSIAWAGPDGQIDPPQISKGIGDVSGDDALLLEGEVEDGGFALTISVWPHSGDHPQPGELIYCRVFDQPQGDIDLDVCYGNSNLHACQRIIGEKFFCLFPGDPLDGHTDMFLHDQPTPCICYGGRDSTGNTWPLSDLGGIPLQDGDWVYAVWAGSDGQIDPPADSQEIGVVTGDDVLLTEGQIQGSRFTLSLDVWGPEGDHPHAGDVIYCRMFDESKDSLTIFSYYGDSDRHAAQRLLGGDELHALFPGDPGGGHTDTQIVPEPTQCLCYGGRDSLSATWSLLDFAGDPLQDGDWVYVAYAGPDGLIDPPAKVIDIGGVTDDDELLMEGQIQDGGFVISVDIWEPSGWHPTVGDRIYARMFDAPRGDLGGVNYYGNSNLHQCRNITGEEFYCLFAGDPGHGRTNIQINPSTYEIILLGFAPFSRDRTISLTWETSLELNSLGFHLERSMDAVAFQRITDELIPGAGISETVHTYEYTDIGLINGTTYYYNLIGVSTDGHERILNEQPLSAMPTSQVAVELMVFSALGRDGNVLLEWKTASESDLFGFHIERSLNAVDFERISREIIRAGVHSQTERTYLFMDRHVTNDETYYYNLISVDLDGREAVVNEQPAGATPAVHLPEEFTLFQNYPNPFNPETHLVFQIPQQSHVTLKIYSIRGQEIITLVDDDFPAGRYAAVWNGRDPRGAEASAGIYFCSMRAGERARVRKMVLLR